MLEAFFTPVAKSLLRGIGKNSGKLGSEMKIYNGKFPDLKDCGVALIGIGKNADAVRKDFYHLYNHFNGIQIADLGNLNHNGTESNINSGMRECIISLREAGIIPIFIGEDHNYSEALLKCTPFKQIDYALVSPIVAYDPDSFAWKLHQKQKFFHTSFIGVQNFMNSQAGIQHSSEVFTEILRLGDLRSNLAASEPLLRQCDLFEFDLSAIRYSDFASASVKLPSGLLNQEACAVCRYAGISNTIGVYILNKFKLEDGHPTDAMQIAQMIWYILDGIENRFNDMPQLNNRNFTVYKCHAHSGEDLLFLYSDLTGRWWMQVPVEKGKRKTAPKFIGCTEADHENAEQGEVPEKWYRAMPGYTGL